MKGGYQILDFERNPLVAGKTVSDDTMFPKASNNKPLLVYGVSIGGVDYSPFYIAPLKAGSMWVLQTPNGGTISITATGYTYTAPTAPTADTVTVATKERKVSK